jgi:uncharacterized protein with GYD domain
MPRPPPDLENRPGKAILSWKAKIATGIKMGVYVVMSKLTREGRKTLKNRPERLKEVNKEISKMGAKVVEQYALLGKYDFLNILEAPDNETVAKVMVALGSRGTLETATMAAIPIDDFLRALEEE